MRLFARLAALTALAMPGANPSFAADFIPLGATAPFELANGVSPDGKLVLTNRHVWTEADGFQDVSPGADLYTRDISNNAIVAGLRCGPTTGSCYEAFSSPVGGPMSGLGAFDNWSSDAFAITPDGSVIVGTSSFGDGTASYRWNQQEGLVWLGPLFPVENSTGSAFDVSADGDVIVGYETDRDVTEAYRWTEATGMMGLGDLPGGPHNSVARAVSADGAVVAGTATTDEGIQGFRWTETGGMVGLGTLPGGDFFSLAYATSFDGSIIVGESGGTQVGREAFIWTANDGMQNLQQVLINEYGLGSELEGWVLRNASDISHNGRVIVGYGENPDGDFQGFVVTVPEPGSMALSVTALITLISVRNRIVRNRTNGNV